MVHAKLHEIERDSEYMADNMAIVANKFNELKDSFNAVNKRLDSLEELKDEFPEIKKEIADEKKEIRDSKHVTFEFRNVTRDSLEEIKDQLKSMSGQEPVNLQKELAVMYSFDKTLTFKEIKILNFLLTKYDNSNQDFLFMNHTTIYKFVKGNKLAITKVVSELVKKGLLEVHGDNRQKKYRINKKIKKSEIKVIEKEIEKEFE